MLATAPTVEAGDAYLDLLRKCLTAYLYDESSHRRVESPTAEQRGISAMLKRRFLAVLGKRGYQLMKVRPFNSESRTGGMDWPCFGFTMCGLRRLEQVQNCIEDVLANGIPGDLLEAGVWRGGCAIYMKAVLARHGVNDRQVWAADSFEGLPPPDVHQFPADAGYDLSNVDYLKVSLEEVQRNFEKFGLLDDSVRFLKGWFKDTLKVAPISRLAVLRLDGDLYESTMDVLKNLYDKVSSGGYVIVDDYNTWDPCKKAVTDFRKSRGIEEEIVKVDGSAVYWRAV